MRLLAAVCAGEPGAVDRVVIASPRELHSLVHRRLAEVVQLKYFVGLTNDEIAVTLGVNERIIRRDWDKARVLLKRELAR